MVDLVCIFAARQHSIAVECDRLTNIALPSARLSVCLSVSENHALILC